jgi:hypothetical protein
MHLLDRAITKAWAVTLLFVVVLSSCYAENNEAAFGYIEKGDVEGMTKAIKLGLSPNTFHSRNGKTLLFYAVEKNSLEIVKVLLNAKADPNLLTRDGKSCIFAAYAHDEPDSMVLLSLLLDSGANANQAEHGATLLFTATATCDYKLAKLLLEHGADANAKDPAGYYPIQTIGGPHGCDAKVERRIEDLLQAHGSKTLDSLKKKR